MFCFLKKNVALSHSVFLLVPTSFQANVFYYLCYPTEHRPTVLSVLIPFQVAVVNTNLCETTEVLMVYVLLR